MRIGGIDFVRSGEGSRLGVSGVLVRDAGWIVSGAMDGVLFGGAGCGWFVARQEAVLWGCMLTNVLKVWGCCVFAGGWWLL